MGTKCCDITNKIDLKKTNKKIVLAGNPNVGKSIFFNYFTGNYVTVSNYPGTTLEISHGKFGDDAVIDTTGVYGISSFNDEEKVARDAIISGDIIVNIVDAVHLERDLFLTQQIIDMDKKVIVALNMMDEAKQKGINIDISKLEKKLGVPVIPTVAINNEGLDKLKNNLENAQKGNTSIKEDENLNKVYNKTKNYAEAVLIMEGDKVISEKYGIQPYEFRKEYYQKRRQRIDSIIKNTVDRKNPQSDFLTKLGRLMIKPLTGIPILLATLYLLYEFIGVFVAQTIVDFTEGHLFGEIYEPFIKNLIIKLVGSESIFYNLLAGEFGLLTMSVTYLFGLLLPLVGGFYLFLAFLEDSGYMPRVAVLVDKMLNKIGLNGRAIIPMILGFGCVTMATVTTRLLGSKREKIITVFLLGLAIPCSAQLGVIAGLIAPLGLKYFLIYIITIFTVYVLSGTFLNKVLPGKSTDLLIDLPPIRRPIISNVLRKTYYKTKSFIKEAGPIFAIGAIIITLLNDFMILDKIQNLLKPITKGMLNLPSETANAFIMGIVRRDFGAAGLNSLALTANQTIVSLIVITLFVPCIAAMMIMIKERSWKEAILIWIGSWITAFAVGAIVSKILIYI
ncbi:MAG: ferrous iron transport protein B [Candidatus Mcinerneyibacterium aminivorans]|uniref:Ferrous iron transport protein B n=1 Tax=Candidatus Mcinerneyibacterium aminivorans TaxID=2703815 RepID=A0A5D0MCN7_9BACT|nr:MAG: ferrous iron transport protein B [Candidatus Mcinerneyibacterium aminivorans]